MEPREAELFRRAQAGDEDAAAQLVARHEGLVIHVARRFSSPPSGREDLLQAGRLALWQAILRFDPDRGTSFASYAVPLILGEVRKAWEGLQGPFSLSRGQKELLGKVRRARDELLKAKGREPTLRELATAVGVSPEDLAALPMEGSLQDLAQVSPDPEAGLAALTWSLFLEGLPPLERELLRLRFEKDLSQDETAQRLGISQAQVSRKERALRRRLADLLGADGSS
ncbi:MAG: sigma-70 family RNA polymerase sigma factor [Clostridiales bacterium]|nr:sigma-70 family RNA polymerase sigma factor [Clostridiales bacterium]